MIKTVRNSQTGEVILARARWCANMLCHARGLMFVPKLHEDEGLLFVYGRETKSLTSITMFFMFFTIGVVWLDSEKQVVDTVIARPWRINYSPSKPAQYIIEANPSLLDRVQIGDILSFD